MENASAQLNNYRHSPRKVRLVADLIRGKSVENALALLRFADKKAAQPISKLLKSAISNAKNRDINTDAFIVKEISVNGGAILYRRQPVSRGRAHPIRKRTSRIKLVLGEKATKATKAKATLAAQK